MLLCRLPLGKLWQEFQAQISLGNAELNSVQYVYLLWNHQSLWYPNMFWEFSYAVSQSHLPIEHILNIFWDQHSMEYGDERGWKYLVPRTSIYLHAAIPPSLSERSQVFKQKCFYIWFASKLGPFFTPSDPVLIFFFLIFICGERGGTAVTSVSWA